jgi:hypothetical protein
MIDDYLKDMLLECDLTAGMEKLINLYEHQKAGQDYSSDITEYEKEYYQGATEMVRSFGPIATEFKV